MVEKWQKYKIYLSKILRYRRHRIHVPSRLVGKGKKLKYNHYRCKDKKAISYKVHLSKRVIWKREKGILVKKKNQKTNEIAGSKLNQDAGVMHCATS